MYSSIQKGLETVNLSFEKLQPWLQDPAWCVQILMVTMLCLVKGEGSLAKSRKLSQQLLELTVLPINLSWQSLIQANLAHKCVVPEKIHTPPARRVTEIPRGRGV